MELARRLRPDVCLLDIRMPGLDGIEVTRMLAGPNVADPLAVVVITTFGLDEYVYSALRAGARGVPAQGRRHPCSPRGRTNSEIAAELYITLSTVKTHITSLMTKLGARNPRRDRHVGLRDQPGPEQVRTALTVDCDDGRL